MQDNPSVAEMIREAAEALLPATRGDEEEAGQQARLILAHAMGTDLLGLLLRKAEPFPMQHLDAVREMIWARLDGEPLQYIFGEWDFMGMNFKVGHWVLIPRQDTETLCEHALILAGLNEYKTALDLCCGSGCIGISMAHRGGLSVTLADIGSVPLRYAMENAHKNGVKAVIQQSDMFKSIRGSFDMILSNPPYIPSGELASLQREVKKEPIVALDGGEDGLDFYRCIARDYRKHLNPGGALLMEVGQGQAADVLDLFGEGYTVKDLLGIERVVVVIPS